MRIHQNWPFGYIWILAQVSVLKSTGVHSVQETKNYVNKSAVVIYRDKRLKPQEIWVPDYLLIRVLWACEVQYKVWIIGDNLWGTIHKTNSPTELTSQCWFCSSNLSVHNWKQTSCVNNAANSEAIIWLVSSILMDGTILMIGPAHLCSVLNAWYGKLAVQDRGTSTEFVRSEYEATPTLQCRKRF